MKATGVVRRIDDLGRIVIPKELRRSLRIQEGDPLEIFTDDEGGVVFRKYDYTESIEDSVQRLREAVLGNQDLKNSIALIEKITEIKGLLNTEKKAVYEP